MYRYTYAELRETVRKIAAQLKQEKIENQPIGVIADRGIETLAFLFNGSAKNTNLLPKVGSSMEMLYSMWFSQPLEQVDYLNATKVAGSILMQDIYKAGIVR